MVDAVWEICEKFVHAVPVHLSTRYAVTPRLSVDAIHDRAI
jgi:hypothetical protein